MWITFIINYTRLTRSNQDRLFKNNFCCSDVKELTKALREIKEGKVSDTFDTYEDGIKFLNSRKKIYTK